MDESLLQNVILGMERELLSLKTSQGYTSTLSAGYYDSGSNLSAGRHTVTYEAGDYPIMSYFFTTGNTEFRIVGTSTPKNNEQYFWLTAERPIKIISSRKIISVE